MQDVFSFLLSFIVYYLHVLQPNFRFNGNRLFGELKISILCQYIEKHHIFKYINIYLRSNHLYYLVLDELAILENLYVTMQGNTE